MKSARIRTAVAVLACTSCNTVEPPAGSPLAVNVVDSAQWAGNLVRVLVQGNRPVEEARLWHTTGASVLPIRSFSGDTVFFEIPRAFAGEHSFRVTLGQDTASFAIEVYGFVRGPSMLGYKHGHGFLPWPPGKLIRPAQDGGYDIQEVATATDFRLPGISGDPNFRNNSDPVAGLLPGTIVVSPGPASDWSVVYDVRTASIVDSVACAAAWEEEVVALPGGVCLSTSRVRSPGDTSLVVRNGTDTLFTTQLYSHFQISAAAGRVVIQDEQFLDFLRDIGGWRLLDFSGQVVAVVPEYKTVPAAAFAPGGDSLWVLGLIDVAQDGSQTWVFDERDPDNGDLRMRTPLPGGFEYRSFHRSIQNGVLFVFGEPPYPAPNATTLFVLSLDGRDIFARVEMPEYSWMGPGMFIDGGATDRLYYVGDYSDCLCNGELASIEWQILREE